MEESISKKKRVPRTGFSWTPDFNLWVGKDESLKDPENEQQRRKRDT